ncbi:MAG: hypothetical protein A2632_01790 [Candidatus Pacebacteria bacterium RIFCSPHIGHO2_01_FULL_46_16]|nr:MAG: hypothetical protein A2632_01790 [Candidatus Pacebacteria bacterium RIFCSPHIGHO2_01_FULL_46_16]OGJ21807.1 MAG: hypothetical protein A3J60_02980 [Candidatus Pacebacteria bacterium RIFCSPHIGHO2_02_FULL_46_9]
MNKSAIIINPDLPLGLLANSVACIASGLFTNGDNLVGDEIFGKNITFIPITKIPILILKPGKNTLTELCIKAQKLNLKYMAFTHEAQSTTQYEEYAKRVTGKDVNSVNLVGLGVVGEAKIVNSLVGNLAMLR